MGCWAVHSHLLYGLLVTHINLIIVLLLSEAYGDPTSVVITNQNQTVSSFDVEKFKVDAALGAHVLCVLCLFVCLLANNVPKITQYLPPIVIITILAFDLVFNIIGGISLWVHTSKPTGHSTSIRGAATISTVACVYTIGIIILYCKQKPMHPSLKELRPDKKLPTSTTQKVKEEKNNGKAKNNENAGTNKNKSKIIQLNETQMRKNDLNDEKKRQQSGSDSKEIGGKEEAADGNIAKNDVEGKNHEQQGLQSRKKESKQKSVK